MRLGRPLHNARWNRRLHGSVAQQLGVRILRGELPEGHHFPGEIEFAEQLGISRSALREAFRILSAKGLVESRPKAGTHVTPRSEWSLLDPELLAWQFETEPSEKFIHDLFELRMVVEPYAAELAALRRTDAEATAMGAALDEMERFGLQTEQGRHADQRFHELVLAATHNDTILALSSSIKAAVAWTTLYKQRNLALARDPMPEHRALERAIAARDTRDARRAMEHLISLALADTEAALDDA